MMASEALTAWTEADADAGQGACVDVREGVKRHTPLAPAPYRASTLDLALSFQPSTVET